MRTAAYDTIDDALEQLAPFGPDLSNGFTSHVPMAIEALCALGRPEAVPAFLASHRATLLPRPAAAAPIAPDAWRGALARTARYGDWSALFAREMQEEPWRVVLDRWLDRLAPGLCAAAAHGVIRVGHAVRSLAQAETPPRRQELADALASWAAEYQELPTRFDPGVEGIDPVRAITLVPTVPPEQRHYRGTIVAALEDLNEFEPFARAIGLLDVDGDLQRLLADLSETFARLYLANAVDPLTTIVFVHGVTSVAALGNLVPHVSEPTARRAARYAWQTGCGLYAAFGHRPPVSGAVAPPAEDEETLVDRAVATGDEHAIKFTEACLSRHAVRPSPVYLAAAKHVVGAL